jgi:hypothetical protein
MKKLCLALAIILAGCGDDTLGGSGGTGGMAGVGGMSGTGGMSGHDAPIIDAPIIDAPELDAPPDSPPTVDAGVLPACSTCTTECGPDAICRGGVCLPLCNSGCPRGFTCTATDGGPGYCQPPSSGCCIDQDGDGYGQGVACAGPDCDDTNPNVHPGATEVCNGIDDDCNGVIDDLGSTTCGVGACRRTVQNCINGQTQTCTPGQPTAEICDGIDNDCNGVIDDLGSTTCGVGACQRTVQNCVNGQTQTCTPGKPTAEICDGIDNDCDGVVDNGNPGGGANCNTGLRGVCAAGTTVCMGGAIACNQNTPPSPETCDGLDNDCDGVVDNGNPGGAVACNTGQLGVCAAGTTACTGGAIVCNRNIGPSTEVCDGRDNDCDGVVDNGNPGGGVSCSTGQLGVCAVGTTACQGGAIVCNRNVAPSAEVCNGRDDDCDGTVDNGNPGGNQSCATGQQGACAAGHTQCQNGGIQCVRNTGPTPETCDGIDNDCDGVVDNGNPGGGSACSTGQLGVCAAGTTACQGGAIVCNRNVGPSAEICDGRDNDCNGQVDENNPGGGLSCSTGQLGVCGAGTTSCTNGAIVCNRNQGPSPEVCDGLDNNCDGAIDEGNPGSGQNCNTGLQGVCANGTTTCSAGRLICNQIIFPTGESCDGRDNDCDGVVDNGNPGGGLACNTGQLGVCAAGTTSCTAGFIVCNRNVQPSAEVCNGLDDNCDGQIDNGDPGGGQPCNTGQLGVCAAGTTHCRNGAIVCVRNVNPQAETCDGLDNDCDGVVDNGNPGGGLACLTGQLGACAAGTTSCTAGAIVCNRNVGPTPEVCDGIDNDCDGTVDNGNPGAGLACNTGQQGVCAAGTIACTGGALVCNRNTNPSAEVCDGLDNDCDGVVDNGNPGGGANCSTGQLGVCAAGTTSCTGGALVCNRNTNPTPEVCDGLDNNCDGVVDEGNPGGGAACSTGQQGICAAGTMACVGGALSCVRNQNPRAETCNGLDDNCNGQVDEGNPGGGLACSTGQQGVCAAGTTACSGGTIVCNRNVNPSAEICDGLDNNCNGAVDEGNPGGGLACSTGQLGICAAGTTSCTSGAIVCNRNANPSPEVCNGLDDNCNGQVDEGNPGGGVACATGQLGICAAGTTACTGGALVCNRNQNPSAEVCNGLDDNCNGAVDEGNPGGGVACSTGQLGVCAAGTTACTGGAIVCNRNVSPSPEVCNGRDDNCNGQIDEGNPGGGQACSTGLLGVCAAGTTACTGGSIVCNENVPPSREICDGLDNDCDGRVDLDAYIPEPIPNSCGAAGSYTVNVGPGGQNDVVGHVDPSGDDFFLVQFTAVGGAGTYFHPKIDLIDSGGGQFAILVYQSCSSGAQCGGNQTTWEMSYPANPNGCQSHGNCTDATPRVTSWIVQVHRLTFPTTCSSYTVRVNNI